LLSDGVLIVGAGPAGLLTAIFVKKREVVVFEEHREVGKPKHCAGFVGEDTAKTYASIAGPSIIDNEYDTLVFYTPKGSFELSFKKPIVYRVDRPLLEEKLLDRALAKGVRVEFGKRVKPGSSVGEVVVNGVTEFYEVIVAADGPASLFRKKYYGGYASRLIGIQYIYRAEGLDDGVIHLFFNELTPELFQWLAPLDSDRVLIGFAARMYSIHPEALVKWIARRARVKLGSRIEVFGGLLPRDKPLKNPVYANRVYFIGDSVPHVKPFTGGGLRLISILAPVLAKSLDKSSPAEYAEFHKALIKRVAVEYVATRIVERVGYWLAPAAAAQLYKFRLLSSSDYDNHYAVVLKTLALSPVLFPKLLL